MTAQQYDLADSLFPPFSHSLIERLTAVQRWIGRHKVHAAHPSLAMIITIIATLSTS